MNLPCGVMILAIGILCKISVVSLQTTQSISLSLYFFLFFLVLVLAPGFHVLLLSSFTYWQLCIHQLSLAFLHLSLW